MEKVCVVIIQTEIPHILRESNSIIIVLLYDDFVDDSSKPIKNLEIFSIKNKQNLVKSPFLSEVLFQSRTTGTKIQSNSLRNIKLVSLPCGISTRALLLHLLYQKIPDVR